MKRLRVSAVLLGVLLIGCTPAPVPVETPPPAEVVEQEVQAPERPLTPEPTVTDRPAAEEAPDVAPERKPRQQQQPRAETPQDKTAALVPASAGKLIFPSIGLELEIVQGEDPLVPDAKNRVSPPDAGVWPARLDPLEQAATVLLVHSRGEVKKRLFSKEGLTVKPGEIIQLDGRAYEIVASEIVTKGQGAHELYWEYLSDPGSLVFVTCEPQGVPRSSHNAVIIARAI